MTRFGKWVRNNLEKYLGKYYEGFDAPDRLRAMVIAFANFYPQATRDQWIAFATAHAAESYRSGYMRGYEYIERDPDSWMPDVPPELIADQMDPNWRWNPAIELNAGEVGEEVGGQTGDDIRFDHIIAMARRDY